MIFEGQLAPDFELTDVKGRTLCLSTYRGEKVVVVAFLRGFL